MRKIILTLLCLAFSPPIFAAEYRFVRINVPGSESTEPRGVNARGDIVGRFDSEGIGHGFLLRRGVITTIDYPNSLETRGARSINARGDIVGNFLDLDSTSHGFLLRNGRFTQIDPPGASETVVGAINNAGDIMGVYFDALGIAHGFIRKDWKFHEVRLPGTGGAVPTVNSGQDNGRVLVGHTILPSDGGTRGFVVTKPGDFQLIEYPGLSVPCTGVWTINQRGDMVGGFATINPGDICHPPFGESHGFVYQNGEFTLIDFPGSTSSQAMGINDDGLIVGRYVDKDGAMRGFKAVPK